MSNKWGVKPEQAEVLKELEEILNRSIRLVNELKGNYHAITVKEDLVIGLKVRDFRNPILPESIGKLNSLQTLNLELNELRKVPESIGDLNMLQTLALGYNRLESLPESIGNLTSLQILDLRVNKLKYLPESIGNMKLLRILILAENKIKRLPDSIGNLKSLKSLYLGTNKIETLSNSMKKDAIEIKYGYLTKSGYIETLPESIEKLQSLRLLDLENNRMKFFPESILKLTSLQELYLSHNSLSSLPETLWQLRNLEIIKLDSNPWEGEWKELAKRDAITLRRILRQRISINIFISHTVQEYTSYKIKDLAEYLENQAEINQVFFCEEDLKGNIDAWMKETVPKSHLLLFIGTKQSIYNSEDCSKELFLARKYNIEVTPIKGVDASWEDLTKVGLSRELGFEFDAENFDKLCENLYKYICEFKRKRDLLNKEKDKIMDIQSKIHSLIKDNFDSKSITKVFTDNFSEFDSLEKELKSKKISFTEFMKKLGDLLC